MSIHRITHISLIKTRGPHETQTIPSGLYKVASGKVSVGRSAHPSDVKARELLAMENKRATWRQDADMPVNRVCQLIGDVPGGGAENGICLREGNISDRVGRSLSAMVAGNPRDRAAPGQ